MNLYHLLDTLAAADTSLYLDDAGRLRFRAPTGALTDALRAAIRHHRDELVGRLRRQAFDAIASPRWTALYTDLERRGIRPPAPHLELEQAIDAGDLAAFECEIEVYAAAVLPEYQAALVA